MARELTVLHLLMTANLALAAQAQPPITNPVVTVDTRRAEQHDRNGWKRLDARDYAGAVREFDAALQITPVYADALYGLGKAHIGLKQFDRAVQAFERCRGSYERASTEDAEHRLLGNRAREDRIRDLQHQLVEIRNRAQPPSDGRMTQTLDIRREIRDLENAREVGEQLGAKPGSVPPFVSLALGSAYFRTDHLADAERAFRAALAIDPKFGEAHSNLALVCLLTDRAAEAQDHVWLAEEARFTINPELKRRIKEALGARPKQIP